MGEMNGTMKGRGDAEQVTAAAQLLTAKEAAAQLGVSVSYIRNSDLPKIALPSGRGTKRAIVRVRQSDLDAWVASHMKRSA